MSAPKANYHEIAATFDAGRRLDQETVEQWLGLVREHGGVEPGMRLLDLGCGTGRFAIPFASQLPVTVTGADASPEMIAQAEQKEYADRVEWDIQDADNLTYPDGTFDAVFMSHLLHHVESPEGVAGSCFRVLKPLGTILVRYGAIEQIRNDVEHRFFGGATEIDELRTLSIKGMEALLVRQSFEEVTSIEVAQHTHFDAADHVRRAGAKFTSVLHLISQESFEDGMARLSEYADANPNELWLVNDRLTLTVGHKPKLGLAPDINDQSDQG